MALPRIVDVRTVARSGLFRIEEVDLVFATGERRTYERLPAVGPQAVIVVALTPERELLLIREYAAGFHELQLTLPKGGCEPGETLEAAANRELKEETGHGAASVEVVRRLRTSPGHMGFTINVVFATDLFAERLPASEPEPPDVVRWPIADLDALIELPEFNEARAIAALALVRTRLSRAAPGAGAARPNR